MMETGRRVGNPLSEGKHHGGLQHPAAKSSDKSRGNLAGSQWKCGFMMQHGTGGQKALCEPKKKYPRDSHTRDPRMLPSGNGPLVPDPITQTAGGLGEWQHQPGS